MAYSPFGIKKLKEKNFSAFQKINTIIIEIGKLIKVFEAKKENKGNTTITVQK